MTFLDRVLLVLTIVGLCASAAGYLLCDRCNIPHAPVSSLGFGLVANERRGEQVMGRCLRRQIDHSCGSIAIVTFGG